ncbi:MAG TPA: histidinol phosphate phosphatase, partial [Clostridiales bacterium]|nr:histidinol phosphate phosphatase [Clostridiales bacterium]
MLDYHIHSTFSNDGEMTMEEACCQAVKLGLKEIAITDHMDIDLPENLEAYQIEDLNLYMEELVLVKDQFQNCLNVKAGIELGLQDWTL